MAVPKEDAISKLKEWGFQPLMTGLLAVLTYYAAETNSEMKEMRADITALSIQSGINKTEIENIKQGRIQMNNNSAAVKHSNTVPLFMQMVFKHEEEFNLSEYLKSNSALI